MFVHEKHVPQKQYTMLPVSIARHDSESSECKCFQRELHIKNHQGIFIYLLRIGTQAARSALPILGAGAFI